MTGSRDWPYPEVIHQALEECAYALAEDEGVSIPTRRLTVVHGACRTGADQAADQWAWRAHRTGWPVGRPERHPAQWSGPCQPTCRPDHRRQHPAGHTTCPAAGYYRNEEMIALGADLCLAFIHNESRGSTHCAGRAKMCPTCRTSKALPRVLGNEDKCPSCGGPQGITTVVFRTDREPSQYIIDGGR